MLTIKDLAVDKELTAKEMASTFGGSSFGNIGNVSGGAVVLGDGNKTRVDNSTHDSHNTSSSYSSTYKSGGIFGGWF
jgi:hypothetical protein